MKTNIFKSETYDRVPWESKDLVVRFDSPVNPPLWGFPKTDHADVKNIDQGAIRRKGK